MEIGYLQEVKTIIKSLVISFPAEITIDKLSQDFRQSEGQPIPYRKLGYQDLETFLRALTDTIQINGSGPTAIVRYITNQKSKHIEDMMRQQKKPKRIRRKNNQLRTPRVSSSFYDKTSTTVQIPKPNFFNGRLNHLSTRLSKNYTITKCNVHQYPVSSPTEHENLVNNNQKKCMTKSPKLTNDFLKKTSMNEGYLSTTSSNTSKNLASKKESVQKVQLHEDFAKSVTIMETKYLDRLQTLPKSELENAEIDGAIDLPKGNKALEGSKFNILNTEANETFRNESQTKPQLPNVFDKLQSSEELAKDNHALESKSDIIKFVKQKNHKLPIVFEKSNSSEDSYNDMNEAVPEFAANNLVFRVDFPQNSVVFGKKIEPYQLPNDIKTGSVIANFISEIHSPFRFWFHIQKENHELDILMHNIERFYMSVDPEDFRIPQACISPGQVCAALYNGMWHRAEIVSSLINNKAKVLFIDYGTVSNLHVNDIKYLATIFANIPRQAIRGCLSHIKPRGLHWSHEATNFFLSNVCEVMLYGQISEIDESNSVVYMILCDTNREPVVQINKALVDNNFALYNENWQEQRIKQIGQRLRYQLEDFPTFSMIENGEYPTFGELITLKNSGTDYESIHDYYLFHPAKLNEHENAPKVVRDLPYHLLPTNPFRCDILLDSLKSDNKTTN